MHSGKPGIAEHKSPGKSVSWTGFSLTVSGHILSYDEGYEEVVLYRLVATTPTKRKVIQYCTCGTSFKKSGS